MFSTHDKEVQCDLPAVPRRRHRKVFRTNYTSIPDRRVLPLAQATLPSVLQLVAGRVLTRQSLPSNTRFGPIKGISRVVTLDEAAELSRLATLEKSPLFLLTDFVNKTTVHIDVSDADNSNWMHYLRTALPEKANLVIKQCGAELYVVALRRLKSRTVLTLPNLPSSVTSVFLPENEKPLEENTCGMATTNAEGEGWVCHECLQLCETSEDLQRHLDEHDQPVSSRDEDIPRKRRKKLFCPHCSKNFNKRLCLKQHIKTHRNTLETQLLPPENENEESPLSVAIDSDLIQNQTQSNITNALNPGIKADSLHDITQNDLASENIPPQSNETADDGTAERKVKVVKVKQSRLVCILCDTVSSTRREHRQHTGAHRQSDGIFCCIKCEKTYGSYAAVHKHIQSKHVEARYGCLHCKISFTQSSSCISHLLTHTDVKQYVCECGKAFKRKQKLKQHIVKKHLPAKKEASAKIANIDSMPFTCRLCQTGFKRRGMLVNHLARSHPDESTESVPELTSPIVRSARYYHCTHCTRVYRSAVKRKKHFLAHHPGEPMPSNVTSWVYQRTAQMAAPQQCTGCHRQYLSRSRLNRHIREAHPHLVPSNVNVPDSNEQIEETVTMDPQAYVPEYQEAPTYIEPLAPNAPTIFFLAPDQHTLLCQQSEEPVTLALEVLPTETEAVLEVGVETFAAEALTYLQYPPPPFQAASLVPSNNYFNINTGAGV